MDQTDNILGRGWGFPPEFYNEGMDVRMTEDEVDVRESLHILLSTSLKERVMQSGYGCDLRNFMFEESDDNLLKQVEDMVSEAILLYEPRITAEAINVFFDEITEGMLIIEVDYYVVNTNSRFNMVYPFYINEATYVEI